MSEGERAADVTASATEVSLAQAVASPQPRLSRALEHEVAIDGFAPRRILLSLLLVALFAIYNITAVARRRGGERHALVLAAELLNQSLLLLRHADEREVLRFVALELVLLLLNERLKLALRSSLFNPHRCDAISLPNRLELHRLNALCLRVEYLDEREARGVKCRDF